MSFDQNFIEKVLTATRLEELIASSVSLKEKGGRLWGCCPFPDHNEKTASFSVNPDRQLYYCFGCKRGGNAFQYLQSYNGYSFPETVEYLAKLANIEIPAFKIAKKNQSKDFGDRDTLLKINKTAAVFFHNDLLSLPSDHPAKVYVKSRGITLEVVEKFRLGVDLGWQDLTSHFQSKKIAMAQAEKLNLIGVPKNSTNKFYDFFHERIMFPIFSPLGDVIGFGGRIFTSGEPKYLNSKETPLFHKGSTLYGLHETAKFIRSEQNAILVEGYMDAIALYTAGIKNVAAILGTAFTPEHAKLIKKYSQHVTMLLDGDEAGMAAAEKSLPILLQADLLPKACPLPEGLDPDDFIKKYSAQQLQDQIKASQDLFLWVLTRWMKDYNANASDKLKVLQKAAPLLIAMPNRQLQELYILELSRRLDVELSWIRKSLSEYQKNLESKAKLYAPKASGDVSSQKSTPVAPPLAEADLSLEGSSTDEDVEASAGKVLEKISLKDAPKDELGMIALVLNSEQHLIEIIALDFAQYFTHAGSRRVLEEILAKYRQDTKNFDKLAAWVAIILDSSNLLTFMLETNLPNPQANASSMQVESSASSGSSESSAGSENTRGMMNDYQRSIKRRHLKNQANLFVNQLRGQTTQEQLEQFMNVQRKRLLLEKPQN